MIKEINSIINELNANDDALLIGLLQNKLDQKNICHNTIYFTEKDKERAKAGGSRLIKNFLDTNLESDFRYRKINKIIQRTASCEKCKHSIVKDKYIDHYGIEGCVSYHVQNNTERCNRCCKRIDILENENYIKERLTAEIPRIISNDKEFDTIWNCKTIINLLTKKLRNYDASKHKINVFNTM